LLLLLLLLVFCCAADVTFSLVAGYIDMFALSLNYLPAGHPAV